jgi:GNAT superfamily N-acetyltransferase
MAAPSRVRYRRGMRIAPLLPSHLPSAELVLEQACDYDRADEVAEEKLFGPGPLSAPRAGSPAPELGQPLAFGAWDDAHELVGVASVCGKWLRVLAVIPEVRGRGAGSALLLACEQAGARRTLDQPGNYLAPGIDVRNTETIAWLERRGWRRTPEPRTNVLIAVRDNPRVSAVRAGELGAAAAAKGYEVRRARHDESGLLDAVVAEFGGAWPYEVSRALDLRTSPGVHVALKDGRYCAFAAHDGNNTGLGWFGPTGTWPAHRGQGLGEALLLACLVDVAQQHERCEVAWIGPRPFYEKVAGIVEDRHFVVLTKP